MNNNTTSLNEKIEILKKIFGNEVTSFSLQRINDFYDDYKFYNCSPEKYKNLLKTRA